VVGGDVATREVELVLGELGQEQINRVLLVLLVLIRLELLSPVRRGSTQNTHRRRTLGDGSLLADLDVDSGSTSELVLHFMRCFC